MSSEDKDIVEIINASKSEHPTDYVSNVIYSGMSRKEAKKAKDIDEAFYAFAKSLNPNKDGVRIETHSFNYKQYSVDDKGKKTNDYGITAASTAARVSASINSPEERLRRAKELAGLS
jgi:CRISPR/Cas system-associated protein Cas10 (large subunit of type III CRISPR-Cas system)